LGHFESSHDAWSQRLSVGPAGHDMLNFITQVTAPDGGHLAALGISLILSPRPKGRRGIRGTKRSQREWFVGVTYHQTVRDYLARPWYQTKYLDWLILDVMTCAKIVSAMEAYMGEKHGAAYFMSGGGALKMFLCKLVLWPLSFILGWVVPAVGLYFTALHVSIALAIGLGAIWYGAGMVRLLLRLWPFSLRKTRLRQMRQLLDEMGRTYYWLAGPVMHVDKVRSAFERATEKGVMWDQEVFYILDHLAKPNPEKVWSNYAPSTWEPGLR
jgi:hypothetical protein